MIEMDKQTQVDSIRTRNEKKSNRPFRVFFFLLSIQNTYSNDKLKKNHYVINKMEKKKKKK